MNAVDRQGDFPLTVSYLSIERYGESCHNKKEKVGVRLERLGQFACKTDVDGLESKSFRAVGRRPGSFL